MDIRVKGMLKKHNLVLIDAFDDVGFDSVAEKCTKILKGKLISLFTDSQAFTSNG